MPVTAPPTRDASAVLPTWVVVATFVACVLLLSRHAIERRAAGERATPEHWAMTDFRDTLYYPAVALVAGTDPWDVRFADAYPVQRPLPPYGPVVVLAHLPLALLPVRIAEGLYFVVTIGLTVALAAVALRIADLAHGFRAVLALATIVLVSRPGRQNLLLGQCTLEVTFACVLALRYGRERPWLGALGIVAASMKPQFAVPLALLLLARGDVRAAFAGGAATAVLSLGTLVLAGGLDGPRTWIASIGTSSATVADAVLLWPRIDGGFLARHVLGLPHHADLVVGLTLLAVGLGAFRRASAPAHPAAPGTALAIASLTILVPLYHITYDALLLVPAVVLLGAARSTPPWRARRGANTALIAMLLVPAANFLATNGVVAHLAPYGPAWRLVTGSNAAALVAALLVASWLAIGGLRGRDDRHPDAARP